MAMTTKEELINILEANLGRRAESNDWLRNALAILKVHDFGDYREQIEFLQHKVNNMQNRVHSIQSVSLQRPLRAQLFAYDFLNLNRQLYERW